MMGKLTRGGWTAWAAAVGVVLAAGCSEEDSGPSGPSGPAELYPIRGEQAWVYDVEQFTDDSLVYRSRDTLRFDTAQFIWAGSVWLKFHGQSQVYWRNGIEGVWRLVVSPEYPTGIAEKFYAFPARPGAAWFLASEGDSVRVVSITEVVDVAAGHFEECVYYRFDRQGAERVEAVWVKPGVGVVIRSVTTIVGGDTTRYSARLVAY